MQVEVNGVMYEPKPKAQTQKKSPSKGLAMLTAMGAMYAPYTMNGGTSKSAKQRPKVDIVKEYGLIQLKQSKLSRSERNWVERMFEKNYKKVDD